MAVQLYFAYGSMLEPDRLDAVAPNAVFQKVAHLPETKLYFAEANGIWDGALPTIRAEEANTVWGALFEVSSKELAAITEAEEADGRVPTQEFSVVDREGTRHWVTTHVVPGPEGGDPSPALNALYRLDTSLYRTPVDHPSEMM